MVIVPGLFCCPFEVDHRGQSLFRLSFCDCNNITLFCSCQYQVSSTLVPTFVIVIISHYFVHVSIRLVSPQSHISLNFCDYNDNTLSWSCQCQVGDTLVSTFQNIYAFTHGQGVSESLYPFKAQTGAGFRVNFRRISEGGYPTAALYVGGKAFSMRCYAK